MAEGIDDILNLINQLNKHLEGYYVIGGSWVLYFYRFKYPHFKYPLRTLDIDFVFSLYVRNKRVGFDLRKILESLGFYPEVTGTVTGYSYTTFKGENVDIEFIIEEPAGWKDKTLMINNLNIDATPLPFVGDLLEDIIYVEVKGIKIPLPSPERFHVHKWIIAQRRQNNLKKQNDLIQGLELLKICNSGELTRIIKGLRGKRKKLYEKSRAEINDLEVY
ncbi:GSU2403 family nucleotidyltransferase fold protein [Persephonella sp.]